MANFSYKLEGSEYILLKDEQPLKTPHGVVVTANSEELAKRLVEALKKRKDYTSPKSILTYHYTYCNLKAQYDIEFVANDFSNCVGADMLMNDDYLLFHQPNPLRPAYASFFEKELPERFHIYNMNQLSAVLVIQSAYGSWILSHYIIIDICEKMFEEDEFYDLETLKQDFLDDLEEYECDELGGDPDDNAYIKHLKEIGDMIDTFVYYFTLGVR